MSKSADYWRQRFDQIEQRANTESNKYLRSVKRQYATAEKAIDEKIAYWYDRLAVNNEITVESAHKLLEANELKEFRWSLEEYINYGRKNAIDQQFMKELENASAKVHIKKLEALKLESRFQIEKLLGNVSEGMGDLLSHVYEDSYYQCMYELAKGYSIGFSVAELDKNFIDKVIAKKWALDGQGWSDRLWTNKVKLCKTLDQEFSKMALTRGDMHDTVKAVSRTMGSSMSNTQRLVYTEQAFLTTQAQNDSYKDVGIDEYMIVATLDDRTCDICAPLDHTHYLTKDMTVGVNAPPFHPNCRCTTAPYIEDGFYPEAMRASRDENGKTVFIPRDMTYNVWKTKFVR